MHHAKFGVVNWFIRLALENKTIQVFGDGKILRDFLHIDDCIDAILSAAASENAYGETFNVGNSEYHSFIDLVKTILDVVGSGKWEFAPFTKERAAQEPGDFYPDISRIKHAVGWKPQTSLEDGIRKTAEYYRKHRGMYW
jgi:UDP-glucose 4-epimerase